MHPRWRLQSEEISCLAWSPRGGELLLGTVCGKVMRCNMADQRLPASTQTGHKRGISSILWAADSVVVLASSKLVSRFHEATAAKCSVYRLQSAATAALLDTEAVLGR